MKLVRPDVTRKLEACRERLLQSLDVAHAAYYQAGPFGGPSLYFHLRALEAGKDANLARFAESTYALLAAWGMHRMGRRGSKMREFEDFEASLKPLWSTVLSLQQATPESLSEAGWREVSEVFRGIRCMATGTSLVGNSKVMAHALPNLVAPVDREYTLRFLFGSTNITNSLEQEWEKLQTILRDFFYPILRAKSFKLKAREWQQQRAVFRWDTSPLKIADNLVIGLRKSGRVDETTSDSGRLR
ncbi:MAG: hypothetical protein A49_30230 [Methyloceanibacter sp.]|nr:MAG: hypothetical protein A49_30230 [Methyloceanibacter sp.]